MRRLVRARRGGVDSEPAQSPSVIRRRWRDAFIVGALLIVGGTALVGWAELSVPSGITSLGLATSPRRLTQSWVRLTILP